MTCVRQVARGNVFFPPLLVALNRNHLFPTAAAMESGPKANKHWFETGEEVAPQQADLCPPPASCRSLGSGEAAVLSPAIWWHHSPSRHQSFDASRRLWRRPPPARQQPQRGGPPRLQLFPALQVIKTRSCAGISILLASHFKTCTRLQELTSTAKHSKHIPVRKCTEGGSRMAWTSAPARSPGSTRRADVALQPWGEAFISSRAAAAAPKGHLMINLLPPAL